MTTTKQEQFRCFLCQTSFEATVVMSHYTGLGPRGIPDPRCPSCGAPGKQPIKVDRMLAGELIVRLTASNGGFEEGFSYLCNTIPFEEDIPYWEEELLRVDFSEEVARSGSLDPTRAARIRSGLKGGDLWSGISAAEDMPIKSHEALRLLEIQTELSSKASGHELFDLMDQYVLENPNIAELIVSVLSSKNADSHLSWQRTQAWTKRPEYPQLIKSLCDSVREKLRAEKQFLIMNLGLN
ncbi:MAG: hypothetical protein K1X79_07755 [Oligoflexia bacterium]|nr:hypothetical protein [Oligoflexia bacterium]